MPATTALHRRIMWLCARSVVWCGSSRHAGRCKGATGGPTRRHRLASRCVPRAAWADPGAQQDKPASPHHHLVPATRGERAPGCRRPWRRMWHRSQICHTRRRRLLASDATSASVDDPNLVAATAAPQTAPISAPGSLIDTGELAELSHLLLNQSLDEATLGY
jgi:hypothetical protein